MDSIVSQNFELRERIEEQKLHCKAVDEINEEMKNCLNCKHLYESVLPCDIVCNTCIRDDDHIQGKKRYGQMGIEGVVMLIFPLKKEWYDKIKKGKKKIEYREVKPYWNKRFYTETKKHLISKYGKEKTEKIFPSDVDEFMRMFDTDNVLFGDGTEIEAVIWTCKLRLGYTNIYMEAQITKIEIVDGEEADLHIDKPVYAIHLANVREVT